MKNNLAAGMTGDTLLFLDFDGVICDSLPETLASSWLAYRKFIVRDMPAAMPRDYLTSFRRYRPYIKNGEDYIVLQHVIFHGLPVASQGDFDALKRKTGAEKMAYYKEIFYQARQELLDQDRQFWFSLNPIFPHMKAALAKTRNNPKLFILSTKKKEFIRYILTAQDIDFSPGNIIDSGDQVKLDLITVMLDKSDLARAIFIDDQIEHLRRCCDARIKVFLASWGYASDEALHNTESIPLISIEKAASFIDACS